MAVPMDELRRLERQRCEESFARFVRTFWHTVEPANPLVWGEPIEAVCLHLQAVTEGVTRRLILNVPPGFSKSLCTNVFFPAWEWGPRGRPHLRYISASYSAGLTERDNGRLLQLVLSPLYQWYWGQAFRITHDGVKKIQNDRTGWKLATSVGGIGTGERGDRILIDDANNVHDVESDTVRAGTNQWLREVMPTRLNDQRVSAIINIQQRTHEEDATGTLLSGPDDWTHLMLPMRYDPDRHCETEIGWSDWRQEKGELAWPERFPEREVVLLEGTLGEYGTAGQLQQAPSPRGGGLIKFSWWREWEPKETAPAQFVLASLDTAVKEREQNDYYALTVWVIWKDPETEIPKMLLFDGWRERAPLSDICERVVLTCRKHKVDRLVIEDKAHGHIAQQEIRKATRGWRFSIFMFDPRRYGDKTARLLSVQHLFSEGLIYAPVATDAAGNVTWRRWADEIITEVCVAQGTLIVTASGVLPIEHVRAGDYVLTHRGRFRPVLATSRRRAERLVAVEPKSLDVLRVTPEHRIRAAVAGADRTLGEPSWVPAGELRPRRYAERVRKGRKFVEAQAGPHSAVLMPFPIPEEPIERIDLRNWVSVLPSKRHELIERPGQITSGHHRTSWINWSQELDEPFGRVLGLYIAEGYTRRHQGATWAFNALKEMHLVQEVRAMMEERIGLRTWSRVQKNCATISADSALLYEFFAEFGAFASEKRLPRWMWEAPDHFLRGVLEGYAEGDGYERGGLVQCTTVSVTLAWQVKLLAMRLGFEANVFRVPRARGQGVAYHVKWRRTPKTGGAAINIPGGAGYSVMRKSEAEAAEVFNLEVLEDNSYVTTGGAVHNCSFPRVTHDDYTDSVSMALRHLRDVGFALRKDEHSRSVAAELAHKSKPRALYPS